MKIIKIFKVLVLTLIALALFAFIGYVSFVKIKEHRISKAVKDGKVVIDQELHNWIGTDLDLLDTEMLVRNTSKYSIDGALVFSVVLESKGLEEEYLTAIDKPKWRLLMKVIEELKRRGEPREMGAREKAINSWFARGEEFEEGMDYEPVENGGENYTFKFKKYVFLIPGELIKITKQQTIPIEVRGYLLKVKIDGIEFK